MPHPILFEALRRQPQFAETASRLPRPGGVLTIGGLPGSSSALLVAGLAAADPRRVWVVVAANPPEAEAFEADLGALLPADVTAALYPQRETLPFEAAEHHIEVSGLRVEALEALLAGRARVLVTTQRALQERAEIPTGLAEMRVRLEVGQSVRPADLADQLVALGFERAALVENVGEFAMRGGIIDLFSFGAPEPSRIEFWGDEIVSLRRFDILDQRSTDDLTAIDVLPVDLRPIAGPEATQHVRRSLMDVLPPDTIVFETAAESWEAELERAWQQVLHLHQAERRRGGQPEAPELLFLPPAEARERLAGFGRMQMTAPQEANIRFRVTEPEEINRDMDRLQSVLQSGAARGEETLILCDNSGQLDRLEEILGGPRRMPARTTLALGTVAAGFVLEGAAPPVRVLTDHEIFRRDRRLRRGRRFHGAVSLESLAQLKPGDFVVHLEHGIGQFRGLEVVRVGDQDVEALALEYAGGEVLRVPVYRLDLIERWVSDRDETQVPKLHKIGGKTWKNMRARTESAIQAMTAELLELYAARQSAEGFAFPPDTRWQKEMESSFLYEDTPDQRKATADLKRDMESPRPMDRLLCGDVGYGKTEVAVRAAFKAVQAGKQVAVLAPTTILAEQHLHTFRERLADYPVRIEGISRFRTAKEQQQILVGVAEGNVDILIGTHRLLEPDILFRDVGLLIVDEEQRFGVKHKERLKEMRRNIDVLTLSATPIPRTLHMSLTGLRDLTLIQTPPRDRMPIITHVLPWVDEVIEDAIRRELDRGGQVFFLHNRVQSIHAIAERLHALIPDAAIAVAHGQMAAAELDHVMRRFIENEVQILVTTSIIENGLDVPSANTLIVDRADQFGLSQLYQIRGRVGRSHHRAYCYLLVPENVGEDAEKRLRILEHFTELGSGYAVALKDLELRGAGNLLGAEQSGFVAAVGLETYTRLLEDAIKRIKSGEDAERAAPPEVTLDGAAYLPDDYIPDPAQKLHLYRRLSRIEQSGDIHALREELRDRFGPLPAEVERFLATALFRILGAELGIERILVRRDEARVNFRPGAVPRLALLQGAFQDQQIQVEVRRAMPLSIVLRRFGAAPLTQTLAQALELLISKSAKAA